jgi:hypothetical protein
MTPLMMQFIFGSVEGQRCLLAGPAATSSEIVGLRNCLTSSASIPDIMFPGPLPSLKVVRVCTVIIMQTAFFFWRGEKDDLRLFTTQLDRASRPA